MDDAGVQNEFHKYKRRNILRVLPYCCLLFPFVGFIDGGLTEEYSFSFFIGLRFLFVIPGIICIFLLKKRITKNIDHLIFFTFVPISFGLAFAARHLGGLESDYYFGLIVVSFLVFTFAPMPLWKTFLLDELMALSFFTIVTFSLEFDQKDLFQQVSNFHTFTVFKYFAIKENLKLIKDHILRQSLQRGLEEQEKTRFILGELCHLLNNPLFIAKANISYLKNEKSLSLRGKKKVETSKRALNRIQKVNSRMLEIHSNSEIAKGELKSLLNESDFR
jgi:hypothetical protein